MQCQWDLKTRCLQASSCILDGLGYFLSHVSRQCAPLLKIRKHIDFLYKVEYFNFFLSITNSNIMVLKWYQNEKTYKYIHDTNKNTYCVLLVELLHLHWIHLTVTGMTLFRYSKSKMKNNYKLIRHGS